MVRVGNNRILALILIAVATGCQSSRDGGRTASLDFPQPPRLFNGSGANPFARADGPGASLFDPSWRQAQGGTDPQLINSLADQVRDLNQRLGGFNTDNQQLMADLANAKQRLQAANEYSFQLKQQLTDSITQLQMVQNEKRDLEQQLVGLSQRSQVPAASVGGPVSPPAQPAGGAAIRGNNSLMQKLGRVQITGASARMDGDVIRIEIPSDPLFMSGTYQINPSAATLLDELVATIHREFAGQIVGIEGHWDGSPLQPPTTTHLQLTATQALAVHDYLVRRGLPERQLFTMAMGSNRPRHAAGPVQGLSPNRRIEIVIYPEFYDR
ncbi:MAG TPA: OmpA family protein [Pirellulaceae bacterium]|nr:OmpA family protein [Pirellulaceae bacterium]